MARHSRPTFVLIIRPEKGVEIQTRALRWALKALLRRFGLQCISITTADTSKKHKQED